MFNFSKSHVTLLALTVNIARPMQNTPCDFQILFAYFVVPMQSMQFYFDIPIRKYK